MINGMLPTRRFQFLLGRSLLVYAEVVSKAPPLPDGSSIGVEDDVGGTDLGTTNVLSLIHRQKNDTNAPP